MALLKPYVAIGIECVGCGDRCEVVIWNGVRDWDMRPQFELLISPAAGVVASIVKTDAISANEIAAYVHESAIHTVSRIIVWAKDEAAYERVLDLIMNKSYVEEDDEAAAVH